MKVLQVVPALNAGGVERTVIEITEALLARGDESHVSSAGGRMEADLERLGGILHRSEIGSKNPFKLGANSKILVKIIEDNDIDIVHARSRAPAWPAFRAARATGRPFVTTYHGIYNANSRIKQYYNSIMARGDIIIANSNFTRDHIIKTHKTDGDRIVVIPRGVDMARFDPARVSKTEIEKQREAWGAHLAEYVILLPGRLTRWKGQAVAIDAMTRLSERFRLVILGDPQGRDAYLAEIKQLIADAGLENRIILPGHSADMPTALMAADIVISTSTDPEAFGRVMAEAQAMQKPVVASAHGGSLETVIEGQTGRLVAPGDGFALAKAIESLANWHEYNGIAARKHIAAGFSKAALQAATLAVYDQLCHRRARQK